ncbi:MAG: cupredoxin domain-containing protein [Sphingomicrobium sp.]
MISSRIAAIAAVAMVPGAVAHAQAIPPVQVIYLQTYAYDPTPIVLKAGQPVTLQFINRAGKGHDFTAPAFFRSARIVSGKVDQGKVDLRPGQVANITLIPAPGRYPVHCGHLLHTAFGMRSTVIVQ